MDDVVERIEEKQDKKDGYSIPGRQLWKKDKELDAIKAFKTEDYPFIEEPTAEDWSRQDRKDRFFISLILIILVICLILMSPI